MLRINVLAAIALAASTFGIADAAQRPLTPVRAVTAADATTSGVINSLNSIVTIGSTIDPKNGDRNPYGLTIAPKSGGIISAGDLVVCNFNDALNIQGLGTSIEVLKPTVGARPTSLIADPRLTGCAALAMGGAAPWAAALDANDNPIVAPAPNTIINPLNTFAWTGPWGQAFVAGPKSPAAFYESNTNDGSIVRINLGANFTFDKIATGFPVNHGVPGGILAPSGLTYDANRDILYVVDGAVNAVVAISGPASIPGGGIVVRSNRFGGPFGSRARVLYAGGPLNSPISAALLFNGDLVVGNTGDNRLIEITPDGRLAGSRNVAFGAVGALFGIAASGTSVETTRIYFNDDNENSVRRLSR